MVHVLGLEHHGLMKRLNNTSFMSLRHSKSGGSSNCSSLRENGRWTGGSGRGWHETNQMFSLSSSVSNMYDCHQ